MVKLYQLPLILTALLLSESVGKLMKRNPGLHFDIKLTRLGFENACLITRQALRCQQVFSKHCWVNLISKYTHLVFSISGQASRCQQAFLKPCLVNLISKDTHLASIFYVYSRCYRSPRQTWKRAKGYSNRNQNYLARNRDCW